MLRSLQKKIKKVESYPTAYDLLSEELWQVYLENIRKL
ncbi:MAG: hypothetical protein XD96_1346 [Petrotoga mobilis]|uniref:Uncharacterized protein n=1 Tax=Petrotoga sibirica TaxID=156202 RepID=A0A4V3GQU7_9BACT|nr:MAG: hypothetical protein XD96_1346 [Petrotoga mobilis]TDX16403.1 hypothetical protein C8D74_10380 [Petrotoga sibirica]